MDKIRGNNSGFTLLEVMVAVAILGVFLVPLLITHGDTVRNIRTARELTRATLLAQGQVGTLETLGFEGLELAPKNEEMEKFAYLEMSDEVTYDEDGFLAQIIIEVFPSSAASGKKGEDDKRIGADIETFIANLYFEEEDEGIIEE